MSSTVDPVLPIPISYNNGRYYLFSVPHAAYLRREHRIPGVLTGTLPQSPQQNVFLGLPVQLLPEEARLLVSQGVCYVVDDAVVHTAAIKHLSCPAGEADRVRWLKALQELGAEVGRGRDAERSQRKEQALERLGEQEREQAVKRLTAKKDEEQKLHADDGDALFPAYAQAETAPVVSTPFKGLSNVATGEIYPVTPTLSNPPILPPPAPASTSVSPSSFNAASLPLLASTNSPPPSRSSALPSVPKSYALYEYLHQYPGSTYFLSPGLRFGCQYLVYPGDPLRFHSHFLAVARGWTEQTELLALVGGGRLGTGVKKGFLLGGVETDEQGKPKKGEDKEIESVRCFSIEWSGM